MRRALVRIGRVWTGETDIPEGRSRYGRGCLRVLPGSAVPVVIDHDLERQIGTVDELIELDDVDGTWLAARCLLDAPPEWVRVGTGASLGSKPLRRQQLGAGHRVLDAILEEVTLVLRQTPREPGARVVLLREAEAGEFIEHQRGEVIRRPCGVVLGVR
jgi:hypothetical protein